MWMGGCLHKEISLAAALRRQSGTSQAVSPLLGHGKETQASDECGNEHRQSQQV